ncbi:hypothetical protein L873DRAFT_1065381 [Choiromyces venosus 120613-1]|uniref:Secreted protein n=1 Tax=Choiromyces venosus 120613-1 TaxID=1336337 RepID=A0A3N4JLZ9_9PEZI|nr:hypothetical protein L873DRAFT_1065381 [Choiromyces venosus 120613-1]
MMCVATQHFAWCILCRIATLCGVRTLPDIGSTSSRPLDICISVAASSPYPDVWLWLLPHRSTTGHSQAEPAFVMFLPSLIATP